MIDFATVDARLRDATGRVFPAAQLIARRSFFFGLRARGRRLRSGDALRHRFFDQAAVDDDAGDDGRSRRARSPSTIARARSSPSSSCLTHSSGLPAWKLLGDTRADVLRAVAAEPLESPPGSVARYSDLGFILLGATVENALGEAARRRVRAPHRAAARHRHDFQPARTRALRTDGRRAARRRPRRERARHGRRRRPRRPVLDGARRLAHRARARRRVARRALDVDAAPVAAGARAPDVDAVDGAGLDLVPRLGSPVGDGLVGRRALAAKTASATSASPAAQSGSIRRAPAGSILLSNRVHPTRANEAIKQFRPEIHDALSIALDA